MTFAGDLTGISLGDVFQNILGNRLTGTLTVAAAGGQRFIYFVEGMVTRFSFGVNKGLEIGAHLVQRQYITEAQLDRARKRKAKQKCTLRAALQTMEAMNAAQFTAAAAELVQEQLYDLVSLKQAEFTFVEGKPPLRVFDREQKAANIEVDPGAILMEGARRIDEFSRIHQVVTDDRDVFVALEGWDEYELEEIQVAVAEMLDGRTEVSAILEALPHSRFEILKSLNDLVRFDLARPLTGRELDEMAQEALNSGAHDDAIALLQRALMIERSNTEMRIRLADLLEQGGRSWDASTEYAMLGYEQAQIGDVDRALEFYGRATMLKPEDIGIHEKLVELMGSVGHEDVAAEVLRLNEKLVDAGLLDKARSSLVNSRDLLTGRCRVELERRIAEVEEQAGNTEAAVQIYRQLAEQVAATDAAAQLKFLRRASTLLPADEALRQQVDDLESGRAEQRRRRRRWICRVAALVVIALGLGVMGVVELIAAHQIIGGLQHLAGGNPDTALRELRRVHERFRWTLAGQRAIRLERDVFDGRLAEIQQELASGSVLASIADAEALRSAAAAGERRRRLDVILARARGIVLAEDLFGRINREWPDAAAGTEYLALSAREFTPFHISRLSLGAALRPAARRIVLEALDRLDDPRAFDAVARIYVSTDDPVSSQTARRILVRAETHRAAGRQAEWASAYPYLESARMRPATRERARRALQWLGTAPATPNR